MNRCQANILSVVPCCPFPLGDESSGRVQQRSPRNTRHRAGSTPTPALKHGRGAGAGRAVRPTATVTCGRRHVNHMKIQRPPSHPSHIPGVPAARPGGSPAGQHRQPISVITDSSFEQPWTGKCFLSLSLARVWAAQGSSKGKRLFSQETPRRAVEAPKAAQHLSLRRTPSSGQGGDDPCMAITYTSQTPPEIHQENWRNEADEEAAFRTSIKRVHPSEEGAGSQDPPPESPEWAGVACESRSVLASAGAEAQPGIMPAVLSRGWVGCQP